MKLIHQKNKLNVIKKYAGAFIDELEKDKKERIKLKKDSERINLLRVELNKLLKKSNNSIKALKFYRSEDENKRLRDEDKKLRDEIKRLVDTSKASDKTVVDDDNIDNVVDDNNIDDDDNDIVDKNVDDDSDDDDNDDDKTLFETKKLKIR